MGISNYQSSNHGVQPYHISPTNDSSQGTITSYYFILSAFKTEVSVYTFTCIMLLVVRSYIRPMWLKCYYDYLCRECRIQWMHSYKHYPDTIFTLGAPPIVRKKQKDFTYCLPLHLECTLIVKMVFSHILPIVGTMGVSFQHLMHNKYVNFGNRKFPDIIQKDT